MCGRLVARYRRGVMVEPDELGIGHLFGRVRDAVVVGDARTGRILLWNPAAADVFGYSPEEATAMLLEELVPPALREAHRAGLRRFADSDGALLVHDGAILELPALHSDGREITVELTLTPLQVRPDQPMALAIIRDVTARNAAARALAEAQAASDRANEALRDFIAMVAHDLRGPVSAVAGFVSLLSGRVALAPAEQADFLARIARQVAHMDGIISDLTTATELETGSMRTEPADVDVADAIAQAVDSCGDVPGLTVGCEPDLRARADSAHLVRCVANLLQNARKHGRPPITVDAHARDGAVEIRVRDSGDGLASDDADRVFDRFARAVTAVPRPGLGLGCRSSGGSSTPTKVRAGTSPTSPTGPVSC